MRGSACWRNTDSNEQGEAEAEATRPEWWRRQTCVWLRRGRARPAFGIYQPADPEPGDLDGERRVLAGNGVPSRVGRAAPERPDHGHNHGDHLRHRYSGGVRPGPGGV